MSSESLLAKEIKIKIKKMIELDIDTINIISERMRKRRATRKQIYLIVLKEIADDEITSFHSAFSAMSCASVFYNHENQMISQLIRLDLTSFHRDSMSLELKNFRQMIRHSHTVDFSQVILTKIAGLIAKDT
jgi:RNA-splicing ligase RtcB